jgi:type IV secretion system protein VirD4
MNGNIRKYILPHIPYLFVLWFCIKLGTAYRMAEEAEVGFKLIGMVETITPAFSNFAPGLDASDWLVGLAGAVIVRLWIYEKSKKARNSERMWSTGAPDLARKKTSSRL